MRSLSIFSLKDRIALVSGGAMGLGRAMAAGFAGAGAEVIIVDRNGDGAAATAAAIVADGGQAHSLAADLSDPVAIDRSFAFVRERYDKLDILVNNAGVSTKAPPELQSVEEWERVVRTNVTSVLLMSQRAFPLLKASGSASIINISSISGASGMGRGSTAYAMSKAAVIQLTRELAVEWGTYGIRVNSILPSQFLTPALRDYLEGPEGAGKLEKWLDASPLGRLGEEGDIVGPAIFLASHASSMVTGHQLAVDGGNLALNASGSVRHEP